jgi:hypothetical protein
MKLPEMLIQTFTGKDNKTIDIARILWALGCISFLGCAFYALYKGQNWDAVAFGTGFAALLAGGGAAIGLKKGTEPNE